mgnify:CR=1 FL=1
MPGVPPAARLTIRKGIPVAGGLAGGSADAAAALVACAELWRTGTSRSDLAAIAAELGSDVPFALTGGCAVGTGRGERLSPAMTSGEFHFVLAFADHGIATPDAYRALDRMRGDIAPTLDPNGSRAVLDALRRNDVRQLAAALVNDLQKPALSLSPGCGEPCPRDENSALLPRWCRAPGRRACFSSTAQRPRPG